MTPEALAKSGELAEAVKPSPADYANMAARYFALKEAKYVTTDGDVLPKWQYDKEVRELADALRERVEADGPIEVEGLPPLIIENRSERFLSADGLIGDAMKGDSAARRLVDELVRGGLLTVKWTTADALKKAGQLMGLSKYEVRGNGAGALKFDKRPRA